MTVDFLFLEQVAEITGKSPESLLKACQRGKYPFAVKVPRQDGKKTLAWAIPSEFINQLVQPVLDANYAQTEAAYLERMRLDGRDGSYIDNRKYLLRRYWEILGEGKSLQRINAYGLQKVFDHYVYDPETKRDYYSTKTNLYKAILGFTEYLVSHGQKGPADVQAIKALVPQQLVQRHRGVLEIDQVTALRKANQDWCTGQIKVPGRKGKHTQTLRSDFDIALIDLLICLYAFAGLRRFEAGNILLSNVHLENGYFSLIGKHRKERVCVIFSELADSITNWLPYHNPSCPYLIHNEDLGQLHIYAMASRFKRFYEATGLRIRPHDLRRTFATIAAERGMPVPLIQAQLGHDHVKTTQGYMQIGEKSLISWASNNRGLFTHVKAEEPEPQTEKVVKPVEKKLVKPGWVK